MASLLFYRAGALVVVGIMAGAVHSLVYSKSTKHGPITLRLKEEVPAGTQAPGPTPGDSGTPNVKPPVTPPPAPSRVPVHISIEQAKTYYDSKAPFVDSRHIADYEEGHVENALLMSADDFLAGTSADVLGYLDKDKPFVVYCSGGACDASENLVMLLQQAGYKEPHIMTDGYPGWQKAGYPTGTGKPLVGGGG